MADERLSVRPDPRDLNDVLQTSQTPLSTTIPEYELVSPLSRAARISWSAR